MENCCSKKKEHARTLNKSIRRWKAFELQHQSGLWTCQKLRHFLLCVLGETRREKMLKYLSIKQILFDKCHQSLVQISLSAPSQCGMHSTLNPLGSPAPPPPHKARVTQHRVLRWTLLSPTMTMMMMIPATLEWHCSVTHLFWLPSTQWRTKSSSCPGHCTHVDCTPVGFEYSFFFVCWGEWPRFFRYFLHWVGDLCWGYLQARYCCRSIEFSTNTRETGMHRRILMQANLCWGN